MSRGKHMAQILSFRTPEFRAGADAGANSGGSAEVILFPGVRYERWKDDRAERAAMQDAPVVRRDVLEIAD